jgi:hypothetical protein
MPNPVTVGGVVGTDNVSPQYTPGGLHREWAMSEIYLGQAATNKHVPLIGDTVVDITGAQITRYIVKDINLANLVPVLVQEEIDPLSGTFTDADILVGAGVGQFADTYRLYVDKSVTPYKIQVDERCRIGTVSAVGVMIFRGADLSNQGQVISQVYDSGGNLIGQTLALQLLSTTAGVTNTALKNVAGGYTTVDLKNNELVTAVVYDMNGLVLSKRQLLVEETAYIASNILGLKYITGITLESPFMSSVDDHLIEYPFNLPTSGLDLRGVVHYSNGDTLKLPVDGGKFTIFGFDGYAATQAGQRLDGLVLRYSLDSNEATFVAGGANGSVITEPYRAITVGADGTYGIKLYPYPVWVDFVNGYRLKWFMYNLARNAWYDATNYVSINTQYSVFDPIAYGIVQRLSVSVNINAVNALYRSYVHTQVVDIVLARQGTERVTPWLIGFTPDQNPRYGVDTQASAKFISTNRYEVKVGSKATTMQQWLDKLYYAVKPLYAPNTEVGPLAPTHFEVNINGTLTAFTIDQWNAALTLNGNFVNGMTIYIHWTRRIGSTVLYLGVSGMPLWYVDSSGAFV